MAIGSIPTLLSLDRFAKIIGISPVHFNGAVGTNIWPMRQNVCEDLWFQHSWQHSDAVGREGLNRTIAEAEAEFTRVLRFSPARTWTSQEIHPYPRHHRRDVYSYEGRNIQGKRVSVTTCLGKVIAGGRRGIGEVETGVVVVYSDDDLDGFYETATVTIPLTAAEQAHDACTFKAYFEGYLGAREWEIRPARSKTILGGSWIGVYDSWLFIRPDLWNAPPTTAGATAIDLTGDPAVHGAFVTEVDVYREYNDNTQTSAEFYWESDCAACALTTQTGCLSVRDAEAGIVVPAPATYSSGQWVSACYTLCQDPSMVKIWYESGDLSEAYLNGSSCEPLKDTWARAIAWLTVARLERPFCACANLTSLAQHLREDLAFTGTDTAHQIEPELLANPFGTRRGEVMAWRAIVKANPDINIGAAVL